jgi:hypothetical protein
MLGGSTHIPKVQHWQLKEYFGGKEPSLLSYLPRNSLRQLSVVAKTW